MFNSNNSALYVCLFNCLFVYFCLCYLSSQQSAIEIFHDLGGRFHIRWILYSSSALLLLYILFLLLYFTRLLVMTKICLQFYQVFLHMIIWIFEVCVTCVSMSYWRWSRRNCYFMLSVTSICLIGILILLSRSSSWLMLTRNTWFVLCLLLRNRKILVYVSAWNCGNVNK